MYTFINIVKFLWKTTYIVMLIYRGHEQLKPIYDNASGTSKKELSQFGHQINHVYSNIANCFWEGVIVPSQGWWRAGECRQTTQLVLCLPMLSVHWPAGNQQRGINDASYPMGMPVACAFGVGLLGTVRLHPAGSQNVSKNAQPPQTWAGTFPITMMTYL